jgi:two-component system, NtrC family, response regulator AtoC
MTPPCRGGDNRPAILGRSAALMQLLAGLYRLAQTEAKVLITGESGVGKELVASYIHAHSRREGRPFVAVNCAGLPETLLESELFGHVKGSFTGAHRDKSGKFELANSGTLFLDEVGEMTLRMQGLLLRVLETGELQKVGSDHPTVHADARVIAATNRNLPQLVRKRIFREDLYYRLNVIHVHVPPLRERREDIPVLAQFFLQRAAAHAGIECSAEPSFFAAAQGYDWPGNVRQLDHIVQRLVISSTTGLLTDADLAPEITSRPAGLPHVPAPPRERRRAVADRMYERITAGASFWEVVHKPYMAHDITNADVRAVVERGITASSGNYRIVTRLFNIPPGEYRKFLSFLRKRGCMLQYRDYR